MASQDLLTIQLVPRPFKHNNVLIGNLKGFLVNKLNQTATLVFVIKNHKHYNIKYVDQRWTSDYCFIMFVNNQHIAKQPK